MIEGTPLAERLWDLLSHEDEGTRLQGGELLAMYPELAPGLARRLEVVVQDGTTATIRPSVHAATLLARHVPVRIPQGMLSVHSSELEGTERLKGLTQLWVQGGEDFEVRRMRELEDLRCVGQARTIGGPGPSLRRASVRVPQSELGLWRGLIELNLKLEGPVTASELRLLDGDYETMGLFSLTGELLPCLPRARSVWLDEWTLEAALLGRAGELLRLEFCAVTGDEVRLSWRRIHAVETTWPTVFLGPEVEEARFEDCADVVVVAHPNTLVEGAEVRRA